MKTGNQISVEKQFRMWRMKVDGRNFYYSSFRLLAHELEKLETENDTVEMEVQ